MRAGGCSLQQGLTPEAASVVKQAVTLARRRGHAQVTPLHVASTMLSASAGLLRTACLQSHSHPLQCKALELCFNVALNRLPASNSSPMLGHHHHHHHHTHSANPSISNALIAAFKRAQAHQRRGSIESQQQPLLAVKIELEQLIISILDDPSVSRVMREAGFLSTQVKSNVEQAVSLEICSVSTTTTSNNNKSKESSGTSNNNSNNNNNLLLLSHHHHHHHHDHHQSYDHYAPMVVNGLKVDKGAAVLPDPVKSEDVMSVVECLVSKKKRGVVVVGECIDSIEGVVRGVMDKVEKEDVPECLREVKFITLTLSSLGNYSRVEVDQKLGELKSLLRSCISKGVILYLGDLKWTDQYRANSSDQRGYYCPVEHMVMEIGKLLCGVGENNNARFWVMGISTFQTYMRSCKSGQLSLETIWGIHPLTIPAGSLSLSLHSTQSELKSDEYRSNTMATELNCCAECSAKFEAEAQTLQNTNTYNTSSTTSNLPAWLLQCKKEDKGPIRSSNHDKNCEQVLDLCKKWNSYCYSVHHHAQQQQPKNNSSEKTFITFSSVSPSSSASGFSYDHHFHHNPNQSDWRDQNFWATDHNPNRSCSALIYEQSLRLYFPENKENNPSKQPTVLLSSNPNSTPTSASSSDVMEAEYSHKFKELNSENLKTLCEALECKVPWQKDIIPEIASTILKCRSGMVRRKGAFDHAKEETWFFFQGVDTKAKEKIAKELARLVFGSRDNFVTIALSCFSSSTRADSTEDFGRNIGNCKRSRDEQSCSHAERFGEAVSFSPSRVFLVEDFEQADYFSQMKFKRAIESGRVTDSRGEEVELRDAIVILSCESFSSRSRACSPKRKQTVDEQFSKQDNAGDDTQVLEETISPCLSLDLNISFDDYEENVRVQENHSIDDIGLLECVDRRIVFKVQEL